MKVAFLTAALFALGAAKSISKEGRAISLFNIVTFKNEQCTSGTSTGTCYSSQECSDKGGSAGANCASGFGVCCMFTLACGSTITQNCSYVQNPSYPNADTANNCMFTVRKCQDNICTIRLDFERNNLAPPDALDLMAVPPENGECNNGGLAVNAGSGRDPPFICGMNSGLHMYIEAGSGASTTSSFSITGAGSFRYKVSQIPCGKPYSPPPGCTQFHTGVAGQLESYNFDGLYKLNNQNYANCVRQERGYCSIAYTPADDTIPSFGITSGTARPAKNTQKCPADAVTIRNSHNIEFDAADGMCNAQGIPLDTVDVYCGGTLNCISSAGATISATIVQDNAPFEVHLRTNNNGSPDVTHLVGYLLNYRQLPC